MEILQVFLPNILILPAILVALALSFVWRHKPWGVLCWIPCAVAGVLVSLIALRGLARTSNAWAGMGLPALLPALAICAGFLVACWHCRPPGGVWRKPAAWSAIALWLSMVLVVTWQNRSTAVMTVLDPDGLPLSGLQVDWSYSDGGTTTGRGQAFTDEKGTFSFSYWKHQRVSVDVMPRGDSGSPYDSGYGVLALEFGRVRLDHESKSNTEMEVRHRWQRQVGTSGIAESLTEILPWSREIRVKFRLPGSSLNVPSLHTRVEAAMAELIRHPRREYSLGTVCRNVEAIESIPQLAAAWRKSDSPNQKRNIEDGLCHCAEVLRELYDASVTLEKAMEERFPYPSKEELEKRAGPMLDWANAAAAARSDPATEMACFREAVFARAEPLVDFALTEWKVESQQENLLRALGGSARHFVPNIVKGLIANPPAKPNPRDIWGCTLRDLKAERQDLLPLLHSDNKVLREIAKSAAPD